MLERKNKNKKERKDTRCKQAERSFIIENERMYKNRKEIGKSTERDGLYNNKYCFIDSR